MKKIVNPCKCEMRNGRKYNAFARIEFDEYSGRLSICGVVGPTRHGNCMGSAGQCVDEIREGIPTEDWSEEMLSKFCDIWDRWHLNDMRPTCEHQRELGWDERAKKKVYRYNICLTDEIRDAKRKAEKEAIKALREGVTFTPTEEQVEVAVLPDCTMVYSYENEPVLPKGYKRSTWLGHCGQPKPPECTSLGWVYPKDFDDGLLTKPCPVCGYKYGSAWLKEDVPEEVINFLKALPDTKITPAWV